MLLVTIIESQQRYTKFISAFLFKARYPILGSHLQDEWTINDNFDGKRYIRS